MFRLFALLLFFFSNLFACQGGYTACIAKINDSKTIQNQTLSIPISQTQRLVYTLEKPAGKVLKYDPFLSLYLVEDESPFAYPFNVNMRLQLGTAIVNTKEAKEGKFLHKQVGLNKLATYSQKLDSLALITSSCCSLEGIATKRGVIQKDYIEHFLTTKAPFYSDLGVRVEDEGNNVVVTASNPYLKHNPLKQNDIIVSLDSKRVKNAASFMKKILFSKIGSKHTIKIKRANHYKTYTLTTTQRHGGGDISDTFLEFRGIYFNKTLHIVKLSEYFKEYGLLVGDKLIAVNKQSVSNEKELQKYIENFQDFSSLLFERNSFQFFVNIK